MLDVYFGLAGRRNEYLKKDLLYLWLSCIEDMNYMLYVRLLSVFGDLNAIYETSQNKGKFREALMQKNILLAEKVMIQLTSRKLKEFVQCIFLDLKTKNISIISMESDLYPKAFFQMYAPPFCMLSYGNTNLLKQKIVYLHYEEFNLYGCEVYDSLQSFLKNQNVSLIKEYQRFLLEKEKDFCAKIFIDSNFNLQSNIFSQEKLFFLKPFHSKKIENFLYLFIPNASSFDIIASISKLCIIPQAKFSQDKYLKNLVDVFIEYHKDILVVPGNINNKYHYFSNYLIKEGAELLLNKKDIVYYLGK